MSGIIVGLDIGGTGTRAVAWSDGFQPAEAIGGAGNPAGIGLDAARRNLSGVLAELVDGASVDALCAGAAGADGAWANEQLTTLLSELVPGARVRVVNDGHLPLAAAGLSAGVVLIAGTGSIAYGRAGSGEEARAGGWGHLLGDEGSGYGTVKETIRSMLLARDEARPLSRVHRALLEATGCEDPLDLLHRFHEHKEPDRWAAFSGVVFEAAEADPEAARVIEGGAAELAASAQRVRDRLDPALPVVLAGGLLLGQPVLEAAVRRRLGGTVVRLEARPVDGALRLARELAGAGWEG
ncbi:MAG TPA: BadF/BadG/BcrA/BcrD ATPase family protein [Candidatus Dormibacteraeota bacterium]|jgi:N-acetylglucosamine kinase-like BadF-type ATPase|nr:BadF/BadG/BcrA/BcrD ATPase family protein [Candidatus Dormibacteraeota bacterium]